MTTEQEKNQVNEQATTPEPEASEAPEAETKTVQEQLAAQVKACVLESRSCEGLGTKVQETAKELGIGFDELLDQIFEIAKTKQA